MTIVVSAMRHVVSVDRRSSGKRYFEVEITDYTGTTGAIEIGITRDYPPSVNQVVRSNGVSWRGTGIISRVETNIASFLEAPPYDVPDVIMVAVDFDALKIWFGNSGAWVRSGNPSAGTGETGAITAGTYAAASCAGNTGTNPYSWGVRLRSKASQFLYSLPSGFAAWGA